MKVYDDHYHSWGMTVVVLRSETILPVSLLIRAVSNRHQEAGQRILQRSSPAAPLPKLLPFSPNTSPVPPRSSSPPPPTPTNISSRRLSLDNLPPSHLLLEQRPLHHLPLCCLSVARFRTISCLTSSGGLPICRVSFYIVLFCLCLQVFCL